MIKWLKAFWRKHVVADFPYPEECWWCHNNTSCVACKVVEK